ncbi:MAG: hypothetical protein NVS1B6_05510 [Steroidobacteraceae bacterium]
MRSSSAVLLPWAAVLRRIADDLPPALIAKLQSKISAIEITVNAALKGGREQVLEARLADVAVEDRDMTRSLRNDLIDAHRAHLPQLA